MRERNQQEAIGPSPDRIRSQNPFSLRSGTEPPSETCIVRKSGLRTGSQNPSPANRSGEDDVEQHTCPKCDAQPGSPCPSRASAVGSAYHTRRFTKVPR
ncbi:zinc finger domain-containing protein [Streptomyces ardesiacus]|uniref:zinc finger domain-containing protein n=1 Tax=Streptomyces ardesiacus TaxID=285564 RepID=UPI003D9F242D